MSSQSNDVSPSGTLPWGVPQGDMGGATLVVPLENMREMSQVLFEIANDMEHDIVDQMADFRIEAAGADAVSEMVAYRFNEQIHDPYTGGLAAAKAGVANLRAGAEQMAQRAAVYEAQEEATVASFRADPRA